MSGLGCLFYSFSFSSIASTRLFYVCCVFNDFALDCLQVKLYFYKKKQIFTSLLHANNLEYTQQRMDDNNDRRETSEQYDDDEVNNTMEDNRSESEHELELELIRSPSLKVLQTHDKGRGVFARHDIPADTLIVASPALIIPNEVYKNHSLNATIFESYLFTWNRAGDYALALGLGSLFNHSDTAPNVTYILDKVNKCIRYTTRRPIKRKEELCIFYGHGVKFGDKGELLVEKTPQSDSEGEDYVLKVLDSDSSDESIDGKQSAKHADEQDLISISDLPLEYITDIMAPEDIPLELSESSLICAATLILSALLSLPIVQWMRS
jgi:hypothetical protein